MRKAFILLVLLSNGCLAQVIPTAAKFFNKDWEEIKNPEKAVYYRTVEQKGNKFFVTDYYASIQKPKMEGFFSAIYPRLIHDGPAIWYYQNGNKSKEATYENGNTVGLVKLYHENGAPRAEVNVTGVREVKYLQHWNEDGVAQLVQGSGFVVDEKNDMPFSKYRVIKDYQVIGSYYIDEVTRDTIYTIVEQYAEFVGGVALLHQQLEKKIVYPLQAMKYRIEGSVLLLLTINKNGELKDVEVIRSIGGGCDEEAVRAIKKLGLWKPAKFNGISVTSKLVQPIAFNMH